jgi:apolipoprotein N-acyltransferase
MHKNEKTEYPPAKSSAVSKWNYLFLAFASGMMLFLSFPKYGSGFVAWFALIPLFWAIKEITSVRQAIVFGFIAGLVSHIGIIYWITYVVVSYGYLPIYLGIILMLLLACYLSIYTAIFAAGLVFFRQKVKLLFIAPVLWVCLEYIKSYLLTGFPWENLGYSQYLNTYLIQFADISGVYGLSFLIVLSNTVLFEAVAKRSGKEFLQAGVVALIIAGVLIYGVGRCRQVNSLLRNAAGIDVALIQGNIDQSIKWNEGFQKETIDIYEQLSLQNAPAGEGLVVWPETAVPFNFQEKNPFQKQIRGIAEKTKNWFVFGSTSYAESKVDTDYYNSAYLLSPKGEIEGKYDKVHLVPYGEYVPLRDVFPFIKKLTAGMGDFTAGTGYYPLTLNKRKIGVLICYEGILPFAARTYKKDGVELLVNITNDAWFGATSAPFQHFSMAIFRAVETRLYLVRAANTGISAIVDPMGRTIAQTNIFEKASLKGNVKFSNIQTFYVHYGDILVMVCFVLVGLYFLLVLKGRIRNGAGKYPRNDK